MPAQEEPQAGLTGDDGSMSVVVPEHLPVGQDEEVEDSDVDNPDSVEARRVYVCVMSLFLTRKFKN